MHSDRAGDDTTDLNHGFEGFMCTIASNTSEHDQPKVQPANERHCHRLLQCGNAIVVGGDLGSDSIAYILFSSRYCEIADNRDSERL
jgi:hypothetical protein